MCQGVRPLDACGMRQLLRDVVSFANETTSLSSCLIPAARAAALPIRNRFVPYRYLCHQTATCVKPRCHERSV